MAEEKWALFRKTSGTDRNVFLDWLKHRTPNAMAESFKEAAEAAVSQSELDLRHPDRYFFPVAFLLRHSVELQLKLIIEAGQKLGPPAPTTTGAVGHSLRKLWEDVHQVLELIYPHDDKTYLREHEALLLELDRADPDGQSFRYYRDRKGNVNLEDIPREFSLRQFYQQTAKLCDFLDACLCGIDEALEWQAEMQAEYGNEYY